MQDLRDEAIGELTSQGRSEAGFLAALQQAYGLFGIGQALDFAAVAAYWQGAPLAPEWRRELAAHTRLDERESGWRGRSLCAALQPWMLQDQPLALWPQIGERCVLLLAPFLGAAELMQLFSPGQTESVPRRRPQEWHAVGAAAVRDWVQALVQGRGDWAPLAAAYRAVGADPAVVAEVLARLAPEQWNSGDYRSENLLRPLVHAQLAGLLLREQLLWRDTVDGDWAFELLSELTRSHELEVPELLCESAGEIDVIALLLRPLTRAAADSAALRAACAAHTHSYRIFRHTGLLDELTTSPQRWQAFLDGCCDEMLSWMPRTREFGQRHPERLLQLDQLLWKRAKKFSDARLETPAALAWYRSVLSELTERDFEDALTRVAGHCDAAALRALIDSEVLARKRDLPWAVARMVEDCADLVRYIDSGRKNVAAQAASQLVLRALDDERPGWPHEPYWSALLALGPAHADLLIEHTVDSYSAASDSMARWEALFQAARQPDSRRRVVDQCLRALADDEAREARAAVLALCEHLYRQDPAIFHALIANDEVEARPFNASLRDAQSPLHELVASVSAAYLCRARWFSGMPQGLDPAPVRAALAMHPQSYAALTEKHRLKLVPLMDAAAVAACGASVAELMSAAGKLSSPVLVDLIARTPLAALQQGGLLDVQDRTARLLLLTGLALNSDPAAPGWVAAAIHDKAHDDYSRGLSLDLLQRNGHSLQELDPWAGASLEQMQALAAKQKITAAAQKAWTEETAKLLAPLGEALGRCLLQVLINAGEELPRRARQILDQLPPARRTDFAAYGVKVWIAENGADKFGWLLLPLAVYGDERVANDLVRAAKAWMKTRKQKASAVMHLLCRVPGIYGIAQVREMWESRKFSESIQHNAREALSAVAAREGLALAEYLEQLVPDFGFETDGLKLNLGSQVCRAQLRGDFGIVVVDAAGKRGKSLPRARPGDDKDLRGVAENQLKMLAKNLKPLFKQQSQRLLRALQTGKSWDAVQWRSLFVAHPLLSALAQSVVWSVLDEQGGSLQRLRPSAGGELVDANDSPCTIAGGLRIAVAHPLQIPGQELEAWRAQFADYELISPFAQFDIPVYSASADELQDSLVRRADGYRMNRARFGSLVEKWGYLKGPGEDGAMINEHYWQANDDWQVTLNHSGISVFFDVDEEVTVEGLHPTRRGEDGRYENVTLAELPAPLRATLLQQAEALKALAES
ncbi:DUF4132 domain-containing protein [Tahibacter harae]|uniref:DUF4132 domain-containing protein n=1 Tax=Tahibacter harae TaxID=2963937 RepID=A0ABT1QSV3_9GAMM|nr:DUF4132 domain-containing protein [Tahibacter harae]